MPRKRAPIVNLLGPVLAAARARGTPWKVLEIKYRLGRTRLFSIYSGFRISQAGQEVTDEFVHKRKSL